MEVARLVAMGMAKRQGIYGHALDDLLGDAYLAAVTLCREWNPEKGVPRTVYVGKFCGRRTIDLYRQRTPGTRKTKGQWDSVSLDEEWDTPEVGSDMSEVIALLACIPEGRERYVICRLLEGAYHREIAAELGISKTRVKQLIERVQEWCEAEL
jgi:RNA polymerase sigma factor (sigma-70 family)